MGSLFYLEKSKLESKLKNWSQKKREISRDVVTIIKILQESSSCLPIKIDFENQISQGIRVEFTFRKNKFWWKCDGKKTFFKSLVWIKNFKKLIKEARKGRE